MDKKKKKRDLVCVYVCTCMFVYLCAPSRLDLPDNITKKKVLIKSPATLEPQFFNKKPEEMCM